MNPLNWGRRNRARKNAAKQQAQQAQQALQAASGFTAPRGYGPTGATGVTAPMFVPMSSYATTVSLVGAVSPTPPSPVLMDRGTAIEPIVGLRSFYIEVDSSEPLLLSYNATVWPHRTPLHALCGTDVFADHDVPHVGCACGIYAWNKGLYGNVSGNLYGEVYLWGDVLICDQGYRAEIAYPKSLTIAAAPTRAVKRMRDALEEAYGVPVTIHHPSMTMAAEGVNFTSWSKHFEKP